MGLRFHLLLMIFLYGLPERHCQFSLQTIKQNGVYSQNLEFVVNENREYSLFFPKTDAINPYTIQAWSSNASVDNPVMVVVRQNNDILSWEVPLSVSTTHGEDALVFYTTSRTLCNNANVLHREGTRLLTNRYHFILTVSTSCPQDVNIFIRVEEEHTFYVSSGIDYSILVTPSESKYVHYKFPENETRDMVLVQLTSDDNVCVVVSVQDDKCPVFNAEDEMSYRGKYQTLSRKGGLTVERSDFYSGFFLVFSAKADNYHCSLSSSNLANFSSGALLGPMNRTANIKFKIVEHLNLNDYWKPTVTIIMAIVAFQMICIVMVWGFIRFGYLSSISKKFKKTQAPEVFDAQYPTGNEHIQNLLSTRMVLVSTLAQYPNRAKNNSFGYLWHIFSIATFYSIPVVQLVLIYQSVIQETGNYDICYYNFQCAHPALGLIDFNHVFSNVGYVFIGFLFLFVSLYRHSIMPIRPGVGIPVHYGLYYAMGIALIIEGVLSSCYHICPSQGNFQFDTSFMYVIAVMCMIKLYQNRHPDINATAYATFVMLGVTIFIALFGLTYDSVLLWLGFGLIYATMSIYVSFKIYFFGYVVKGLKNCYVNYKNNGLTKQVLIPIRKYRFILLLIANTVNYALLAMGIVLYQVDTKNDFGTFLLTLLMGNAILYSVFYTLMKIVYRERLCIEAIGYGLLAIGFWAWASYYFFDPVIQWTGTPAESRLLNQDCIWMDFFDKHDIWHLLSAPALYFTFMFLICLDDDLVEKSQDLINVF